MDSRLTRWTDPLIVASGCFSLLCYQDRESAKSGRRDLFTVSLSLYCFFPSFLEWKTVTMLCPTSGRHTWGNEQRKTLAQGQKETAMISPPTSKRPNPANNHWCPWQGTYGQVSLYWRPLPQSTALGSFKSDPEAKTASSATPGF